MPNFAHKCRFGNNGLFFAFHLGVSGNTQHLVSQSAVYSIVMATVHGGRVH